MATPAAAPVVTTQTPITIKVNHDGAIRRFKVPLDDLSASKLSPKFRAMLAIPDDTKVNFERYSDSGSAWVRLDPQNPQVFKQLWRAARAKLKLRIRVVPEETATEPKEQKEEPNSTPVLPIPTFIAGLPPAYTSSLSLASTSSPVPTPSASSASRGSVSAPRLPETPVQYNNAETVENARVESAVADALSKFLNGGEYIEKLKEQIAVTIRAEFAKNDASKSIPVPPTQPRAAGPPRCPYRRNPYNQARGCHNRNPSGEQSGPMPVPMRGFAIYCNSCRDTVNGVHFHCSKCEGGDYDLCPSCVEKGIHCSDDSHWLIKRIFENGGVVRSSTESVPPKKRPEKDIESLLTNVVVPVGRTRTCNCCVASLPEPSFVTCNDCPDYDVCITCHEQEKHGHNPSHSFKPACETTRLSPMGNLKLKPGRHLRHLAVCDGCDMQIYGVRHKCLNCPDWDYCANCINSASFKHPGHRFAPIYEHLTTPPVSSAQHHGIYCDGPLCKSKNGEWISGDRYKCAVCPDTDFCSSCEALPTNRHNKSHPLIKLKQPIRKVLVSTFDEGRPGNAILGDGPISAHRIASAVAAQGSSTSVQTVAETKPTEPDQSEKEFTPPPKYEALSGYYIKDSIADGTMMRPGQKFTQTWTIKNDGNVEWPQGVTLRFVGGDHMFNGIPVDKVRADIAPAELAPGSEIELSVDLTAPEVSRRRIISYWRLVTTSGERFGPRLWCDIEVIEPIPEPEQVKEPEIEETTHSQSSSQFMFPRLNVESPVPPNTPSNKSLAGSKVARVEDVDDDEVPRPTSVLSQAVEPPTTPAVMSSPPVHTATETEATISDFEDDDSHGFLTDDEDYEVLDASDQEGFSDARL